MSSKIDTEEVEQRISWIGARLREPSTYAGLAIVLGALFGFRNADQWASALTSVGIGVGGIIAIVLPEARKALVGLLLVAFLLNGGPAHAQKRAAAAGPKPGVLTQAQAKSDPLAVLQTFATADLQAALADAQAQTPPDQIAINCYVALIPLAQSGVSNPLPKGLGAFQLLQKARDAKALLANIQSPTGPLSQINAACAPLVLDAQNTLVQLGIVGGTIAATGGVGLTLPAFLPGLLPFPLPF
jgi:hypothetical protein